MKFYIFSFLLLCLSVQSQENASKDCISITEFVMQFLAKSSTKYRGSTAWINDLSAKNAQVETAYAKTWNHHYQGLAAFALHNAPDLIKTKENMLTSSFKVKHTQDDTIIIDASISDTEFVKMSSEKEADEIQKKAFQINGTTNDLEDALTKCSVQHFIEFDEQTNVAKITQKYNCKTTLEVLEFLKDIKRFKNKN